MIAPWVLAGGLFSLGALCAHGVYHWYRRERTMSRWPTAPGTITSTWDSLDDGKIRYSYQVGAKHYVGGRVFWSTGKSTSDRTPQELTEAYPPGSDVTVYYDPTSPKTSLLEPWNRQNMYGSLLFACAFWLICAFLLIIAHHNGALF